MSDKERDPVPLSVAMAEAIQAIPKGQTMKYRVELARMVRETKVVVVECGSAEVLSERLGEVYDKESGEGWESDTEWGCEPGTHQVIGPYIAVPGEETELVVIE